MIQKGGFGRYATVKSNGSLKVDCEELNEEFHELAQIFTNCMGGFALTNCRFKCNYLLKLDTLQDGDKYGYLFIIYM
jgi:hypothetical protein